MWLNKEYLFEFKGRINDRLGQYVAEGTHYLGSFGN
jgi:hypothetical protein